MIDFSHPPFTRLTQIAMMSQRLALEVGLWQFWGYGWGFQAIEGFKVLSGMALHPSLNKIPHVKYAPDKLLNNISEQYIKLNWSNYAPVSMYKQSYST
ncbi:MAG: hypothetical protein KUG72_01655 [Pseudomonadales bacterium]|nr:hypothetical protein [Pseudomonadales bacterium]